MERVKVDNLTGGEYLAKPVISKGFHTVLFEGTKISVEDIEFLKEIGIEEVVVFETDAEDEIKEREIIKKEIHDDCAVKMKTVLKNHICKDNSALEEITEAAESIIDDIFDTDEIAIKVFDIKKRSGDLYDHCITVSSLSVLTAMKMNLNRENVYDIGIGSLLHDLGLKYISVDYTNKEGMDFTPEDLFEYKKHTVYGFSSVENENWMSTTAKKIILFHHERIDGTGYPFRQTTIPLAAEIVSVCDGFDDRICGIGYRQMSVAEALDDIQKYRDVHYDGKVIDVFLSFIAVYPVGTLVKTNRGDEAIVFEQNEYFTDKPIIKLLRDFEGKPYNRDKFVNLSENRAVTIEAISKPEEEIII